MSSEETVNNIRIHYEKGVLINLKFNFKYLNDKNMNKANIIEKMNEKKLSYFTFEDWLKIDDYE
jgi:hypothetical protein